MSSRDPFSTPEPQGSSTAFPPYHDGANSNPDLQDYFDESGIPPPHRFSGFYPTTASSRTSSTPTASDARATPDIANRAAYVPAAAYDPDPSPALTSSTPALSAMPSENYANLEAPAQTGYNWSEKPVRSSNRSKWIVIGSVVALLVLIGAGVGIGVGVSQAHKGSSNRSVSNSADGSDNSSSVVTQTNPNDPSTFEKDSRLKQSFYGIAYTPAGSQLPNCGNDLQDVIEDIQLLSQLTTRIRLYGADCNQSALVLEAIKQTKVDMQVWLGNYPTPTDSTAYTRQRDEILAAIQTYGTDNIAGVTVGNEWMLNYLNANGATDPNSAVGNQGGQLLIADIQDTVSAIQALNLPKHIPVGTADAGAYFNNEVLAAVEYGMSNVHPWFANVSIAQAADWTYSFFEQENVQPAAALSNNPKMYIAETGWPSNSSDAGNESNGPSTASTANLQQFLDTFVCQSNTNGTGYFYFEFFDETWKDIQFGGVEGWWGLFTSDKKLKDITIPSC